MHTILSNHYTQELVTFTFLGGLQLALQLQFPGSFCTIQLQNRIPLRHF